MSVLNEAARVESLAVLSRFRTGFYGCLSARADALFELTEAVLCTDGPVKTLVDLALAPEHRRGHGALYDGLNSGRIEVARFRKALSVLPLPRAADGRIVLAVDVSPLLRSDAPTSTERLFCHVYGRAKSASQFIPGWPYSFVAALESGRTSWTAVLDAIRLGPEDDATAVTAAQLREVVQRLLEAGQWRPGDADILIVADAGYDVTRLAFLLADLPVELLGRIRSDRVLQLPAPPRLPGANGRPPKHGGPFALGNATTWPAPARHHEHRHHPLRHRNRHLLGPAASPPHPPRSLAGPPGRTADPGRDTDPAQGRTPARQWRAQAGVVVVLAHRPDRGPGRPALAGVPPQIRS